MSENKFQLGPSSKEEFLTDIKDAVLKLWWIWVPVLVFGMVIIWKFKTVILHRLGF